MPAFHNEIRFFRKTICAAETHALNSILTENGRLISPLRRGAQNKSGGASHNPRRSLLTSVDVSRTMYSGSSSGGVTSSRPARKVGSASPTPPTSGTPSAEMFLRERAIYALAWATHCLDNHADANVRAFGSERFSGTYNVPNSKVIVSPGVVSEAGSIIISPAFRSLAGVLARARCGVVDCAMTCGQTRIRAGMRNKAARGFNPSYPFRRVILPLQRSRHE
jgi:hypothetical protein